MLPILVLIGSFTIITTIGLFLYLSSKPLDTKFRFRQQQKSPKTISKFQNDAPVAPDMLFEQPIHALPTVKHMPPVPKFTAAPSPVEPTPIQSEVAQLLWNMKQVSCVYRNNEDMTVHKNGKQIGLVRCIDGRTHTGHIEDLIKISAKMRVKATYLIALGRIDKPAFKRAIRAKIKIITRDKLDSLQSKTPA